MKQFTRVAGILVRAGAVLTHRHGAGDAAALALPGGHLEFGETTIACLEREMMEEFSLEITVGRLVYIAEGVFIDGRRGKKKHEIVFYYWMSAPDAAADVRSNEEPRHPKGPRSHWLPLQEPLERLHPSWLRSELPRQAALGWQGPTRHVLADETERRAATLIDL